jgi:hypothetical protein
MGVAWIGRMPAEDWPKQADEALERPSDAERADGDGVFLPTSPPDTEGEGED